MLSGMGNKDRRSREKKKPKKTTPKIAPPKRDFGQTTRIINGGIECPGSQAAQDRAPYYKNNCATLMVDPGTKLVC